MKWRDFPLPIKFGTIFGVIPLIQIIILYVDKADSALSILAVPFGLFTLLFLLSIRGSLYHCYLEEANCGPEGLVAFFMANECRDFYQHSFFSNGIYDWTCYRKSNFSEKN